MEVKAITFDYFGTLVDVDKGGVIGIQKVLRQLAIEPRATAEEIYFDWDVRAVRLYRGGAYRRYREIATEALSACLDTLLPGITGKVDMASITELFLGALVEESPPHPDVPPVLAWLAERYPLMPITNMDTDLWKRSQLAVHFDHVTTAEMSKAYKPSADIFKLALQRLNLAPHQVLHCSLASWADIDGAKPLGMRVVWVNRNREELGIWQPRPDFEVADLNGVQSLLSE